MRISGPVGPYFETIEAPSPQDPANSVILGVRQRLFIRHVGLGITTPLAQYGGIVQDGLMIAVHAFHGLQRPLDYAEDMNADQNVVIYSWKPRFDCEWVGGSQGKSYRREPPADRVFVVLVGQQEPDEHGVSGTVEHWNWLVEDPSLPEAPIDWGSRYRTKLWSREIL